MRPMTLAPSSLRQVVNLRPGLEPDDELVGNQLAAGAGLRGVERDGRAASHSSSWCGRRRASGWRWFAGTKAKFRSPSSKCSASPGGRLLNLAETVQAVSGSTKTCQPVTEAICSSSGMSLPDLMSALTRLRLVSQLRVSAAQAGAAASSAMAKHEQGCESPRGHRSAGHCTAPGARLRDYPRAMLCAPGSTAAG